MVLRKSASDEDVKGGVWGRVEKPQGQQGEREKADEETREGKGKRRARGGRWNGSQEVAVRRMLGEVHGGPLSGSFRWDWFTGPPFVLGKGEEESGKKQLSLLSCRGSCSEHKPQEHVFPPFIMKGNSCRLYIAL